MPSPLPQGLKICRAYADYARALLAEHTGKGPTVKSRPEIPLIVKGEIATVVGRVLEAWSNQVRVSYSIDQVLELLAETSRSNKDELLRETFKGPSAEASGRTQLHDIPCIFVDRLGHIVTTYLPGCFSRGRSGHGPLNSIPQVSSSLCETRVNQGGEDLLTQLTEINGLIGAVLAIIHPDLFDYQFKIMEALSSGQVEVSNLQLMQELFQYWSTPFNGVAVIANRETALHRDTKGGRALLDIVTTFGNYENGRFEIPLLSSRFIYNPGTCIALPGFLFEHGASRTDGERVCLASFIRPNVGEAAFKVYDEPPLPTLRTMYHYHGLETPEVIEGTIWD
ncbi:hypothetical protein H1R20_g15211, partial [Candolleomyces eurysporus]